METQIAAQNKKLTNRRPLLKNPKANREVKGRTIEIGGKVDEHKEKHSVLTPRNIQTNKTNTIVK